MDVPYIFVIYSIYTYIYIYFLDMFHVFSLVCFLIYGAKSRSGHERSQSFGPISHVSGPKLTFWGNFIMVLHGFAWRSSILRMLTTAKSTTSAPKDVCLALYIGFDMHLTQSPTQAKPSAVAPFGGTSWATKHQPISTAAVLSKIYARVLWIAMAPFDACWQHSASLDTNIAKESI